MSFPMLGGKEIARGSSEDDESYSSHNPRKRYCRHTLNQTQRLERFYRECANPNKNQRHQLGIELSLHPRQIKFWFQNKRTQTKVHSQRADNNTLHSEINRIKSENLAMAKALRNASCRSCRDTLLTEENIKNREKLELEYSELKHEIDRVSSIVAMHRAKCLSRPTVDIGDAATSRLTNGNPATKIDSLNENINPGNFSLDEQMKPHPELVNLLMSEIAASAMAELIELLRADQSLWIFSPRQGQYVLDHDSYHKMFSGPKGFEGPNTKIESSKDCGLVAIGAKSLVDLYLNPDKWVEIFPTVFSEANTIRVLRGGLFENRNDSLQQIHERMHSLSPFTQQRDFSLLRHCQQIETGIWVIVDVSYNGFRGDPHVSQTFYWKHPSGCMIEEMPNGISRVTCVERVEVVGDFPIHPSYKDLENSTLAFGAKRWLSTLQRTFERDSFLKLAGIFDADFRIGSKNMIMLGSKMIKSYCSIFSLFGASNFHQLSELAKNRVQITSSKNICTEPVGTVIHAASSFCVPASPERVFSYLNDHLMRSQWDTLCHAGGVSKVLQIPTGYHPSNMISLLQPRKILDDLMIFQESVYGETGSLIIYAPVDTSSIFELASLTVPTDMPILASGFSIVPDGKDGASTSTSEPPAVGSLITVTLQLLGCESLSIDDEMGSSFSEKADALVTKVVRVLKTVFK